MNLLSIFSHAQRIIELNFKNLQFFTLKPSWFLVQQKFILEHDLYALLKPGIFYSGAWILECFYLYFRELFLAKF